MGVKKAVCSLCSMFEGDDSASFFSSGAEFFKPLLKSVRIKYSYRCSHKMVKNYHIINICPVVCILSQEVADTMAVGKNIGTMKMNGFF